MLLRRSVQPLTSQFYRTSVGFQKIYSVDHSTINKSLLPQNIKNNSISKSFINIQPPQKRLYCDNTPKQVEGEQEPFSKRIIPILRGYGKAISGKEPNFSRMVFVPMGSGLALASFEMVQYPSVIVISMLGISTILLRSAGCLIKDVWYTEKSPEALQNTSVDDGDIPMQTRLGLLFGHLLVSHGILVCMDVPTMVLGISSLGLVVGYPLVNSYSNFWTKILFGCSMNYACLAAYLETTGSMSLPIGCLFAGGVMWSYLCDTVRTYNSLTSANHWFFRRGKLGLYQIAGASSAFICLGASLANVITLPFSISMITASGFLLQQIYMVELHNPNSRNKFYKYSQIYSWLVLCGLTSSAYIAIQDKKEKEIK